MMRDVQCMITPGYCVSILSGQLQAMVDRYPEDTPPSVDRLINLLAAPLTVGELHELIELALKA